MPGPGAEHRLQIRLEKLAEADITDARTSVEHAAHADDKTETDQEIAVRELNNLISNAMLLRYKKEHPYDVEEVITLIVRAAKQFNIDVKTIAPGGDIKKMFAEIRAAKSQFSQELADKLAQSTE